MLYQKSTNSVFKLRSTKRKPVSLEWYYQKTDLLIRLFQNGNSERSEKHVDACVQLFLFSASRK
ncbi:MAG TPA: hypothetical protein DEP22_00580 [Porphyromonadaceae bacterium]|nr:hypothetical protein [Porphyromonadaceae bacterium]